MREAVTIAAAWLLAGLAVFLVGAGPTKTAEWRTGMRLPVSTQLAGFAVLVVGWPYTALRRFVRPFVYQEPPSR